MPTKKIIIKVRKGETIEQALERRRKEILEKKREEENNKKVSMIKEPKQEYKADIPITVGKIPQDNIKVKGNTKFIKNGEQLNKKSAIKEKKIDIQDLPMHNSSGTLNVKYHGKNVKWIKFNQGLGRNKLNLNTVKDFSNNLSLKLYNKGIKGKIMVTVNFGGSIGYRSGYFTEIGQPVSFYDTSDSFTDDQAEKLNDVLDFQVYFIQENEPVGGCSENDKNDCLYECLKDIMGNFCPFENPKELKDYLKIDRKQKVNINDLRKIENLLGDKYKINVSGDHCYSSCHNKARYEIKLKLIDEHYEIDTNNRINISPYFNKNKKPIFYKLENENYTLFNGIKKTTMTREEFIDFKQIKYKSCNNTILLKSYDKKSVDESFNHFLIMSKKINELTKGNIDLNKTGSFKTTALKRFNELTKMIYSDPISQNEGEILLKGFSGPVIFAIRDYEGPLYKYDYNSMYGALLCKKEFLIPIKEGKFYNLEELPNILKYGMYNCEIEKGNTLFRYNKDNWYTHIDIYTARLLKLQVILYIYEDDRPNSMIYERDCLINSHFLFESYVHELFNLKLKKVEGSKEILNILWGSLCEKNIHFKKIKNNQSYDFPKESKIKAIHPINDDTFIFESYNNKKIFKTNYARLGPFLLAKARELIIKTALEYGLDHVKRIHTDSIISDIELPIPISSKLGGIKFEGHYKNAKIMNFNVIHGEFFKN